MHILLASSSPRRQALLSQLDLPCRILVPQVDEEAILAAVTAGQPHSLDLARRAACALASAKADDIVRRLEAARVAAQPEHARPDPCVVVAADTMVVSEGEVLNKPVDVDDARRMLTLLSGRTHHVVTGVCARAFNQDDAADRATRTEAETTAVTFRDLAEAHIDAYARSGEPLDKAGAYGIQGLGASLVRRIDGCYFNVVGLPISLLTDILASMGHPIETFWR